MTLFLFLSVVQGIVAALLVVLVLMQRSEGGGLGIGSGSPGGFMSARGAADFLTRATKWTAVAFVALAIALAALAVGATGGGEIDDTLDRSVTRPAAGAAPAEAPAGGAADTAPASPAPAADPLAGVAE